MIFSPELAARITQGRKTVTRRPVKTRDGAELACRYVPGRVYAVQLSRGGIAVDRIRVLSVTRERLDGPLTQPEAEREGFTSPAAFTAKWIELYGAPPSGELVWRIEFELVP